MKLKIDIMYIIVILLLLAACFVSWRLYFSVYSQEDTVSIHGFPKDIGSWTSEEVKLSEKEYAILETDNAFVRHYTLPSGEEVNLFIVYSQNNRKVAHPPEICYTGGGTTIVERKNEVLAISQVEGKATFLPITSVIMDSTSMQQVVTYWFKVGDEFVASYWKQQMLIAVKTLLGKPASSALVRISTIVKDDDVTAARNLNKSFAKLIIPPLYEYLP